MHARVRCVPKSRVQYGSISLIAVQKKWVFYVRFKNFWMLSMVECVIWLWITMCISNLLVGSYNSELTMPDVHIKILLDGVFSLLAQCSPSKQCFFFAVADYLWLWKLHLRIDSLGKRLFFFAWHASLWPKSDENANSLCTFYSMWQSKHEKHWIWKFFLAYRFF